MFDNEEFVCYSHKDGTAIHPSLLAAVDDDKKSEVRVNILFGSVLVFYNYFNAEILAFVYFWGPSNIRYILYLHYSLGIASTCAL